MNIMSIVDTGCGSARDIYGNGWVLLLQCFRCNDGLRCGDKESEVNVVPKLKGMPYEVECMFVSVHSEWVRVATCLLMVKFVVVIDTGV